VSGKVEPGGARRSQEEPGGSQEVPGCARSSQGKPGGARSSHRQLLELIDLWNVNRKPSCGASQRKGSELDFVE
jgi:hypothetical protein